MGRPKDISRCICIVENFDKLGAQCIADMWGCKKKSVVNYLWKARGALLTRRPQTGLVLMSAYFHLMRNPRRYVTTVLSVR